MSETLITNGTKLFSKHITWSAVFAGVIAALVGHMLITLLGIAIGATSINSNQFQHLGNIALIWNILNVIFSIGMGAYIAGKLAPQEGALHGLLMFGMTIITTLWLTISFAGSLIGSIFNVFGAGTIFFSQRISTISPSEKDIFKNQFQTNNISFRNFKNNLQANNKIELKSEKLKHNSNKKIKDEKNGKLQNITQLSKINDNVNITNWVHGIVSRYYDRLSFTDREILKDVIRARTGKTDQEIEKLIYQMKQSYQNDLQYLQKLKHQAEQKAFESAKKTATFTSKISWYVLFTILISLALSYLLGQLGQHSNRTACYT